MARLLLVLLVLVAGVAHAGISVTVGGGGGGTLSGLTPNRCLHTDAGGNVVVATGNCPDGDAAGSTPAFSGITDGVASGKTFTVGAGSSIGRSGGGTISASQADLAAQAQGWDSAPADCPANQVTHGQNANKSLKCRPVAFSELSGTATFAQVPIAFSAATLSTNLIDYDCGANAVQYGNEVSGIPRCKAFGFANLQAGTQIDTAQLPDFVTPGEYNLPKVTLDADGRVIAITTATADSVGPSLIDETAAYAFTDIRGKQARNGGAVDDDDCAGDQGKYWYDTVDARFEWCNANSGTPLDLTSLPSSAVQNVGNCDGPNCFTGAEGTELRSNTDLDIHIDEDNNGTESFRIFDGLNVLIAEIFESGAMTITGLFTANQITTADRTSAPGNLIGLRDNDVDLTPDPSCANSGVANELTILDVNEAAADTWVVCSGLTQILDLQTGAP